VAASPTPRHHGVWVPAIRPPTVPAGTARLRVTLSAAHTEDQVALLREALAAVCPDGSRPLP
jgi:8-amino-7-oxononanoate synthase